jgi:SAM-dependent methyltransferase
MNYEGKGFLPEYFESLAALEDDHFWFRARHRIVLHAARGHFPSAKRILDMGCGTGALTGRLKRLYEDALVVGLDFFPEALRAAKKNADVRDLVLADAICLPFLGSFDLICMLDVLEHLKEDEKALRQVWLALRPGGGVLVTVPQHPRLWSRQDEASCHCRRYCASELREKLIQTGFRMVFETSFTSLLLPLMFLNRLIRDSLAKHGLDRGEDPMAELKISKTVNRFLGLAMSFEFSLIRAGVSFPFGGSLLAAALKPYETTSC